MPDSNFEEMDEPENGLASCPVPRGYEFAVCADEQDGRAAGIELAGERASAACVGKGDSGLVRLRRNDIEGRVGKDGWRDEDAGVVDRRGVDGLDSGDLERVTVGVADGEDIVIEFEGERREEDPSLSDRLLEPVVVIGEFSARERGGLLAAEGEALFAPGKLCQVFAESEREVAGIDAESLDAAGGVQVRITVEGTGDEQRGPCVDVIDERIPGVRVEAHRRRQEDQLWGAEEVKLVLSDGIGLTARVAIESADRILLGIESDAVSGGELEGLREDERDVRLDEGGSGWLGGFGEFAERAHLVLPDF